MIEISPNKQPRGKPRGISSLGANGRRQRRGIKPGEIDWARNLIPLVQHYLDSVKAAAYLA